LQNPSTLEPVFLSEIHFKPNETSTAGLAAPIFGNYNASACGSITGEWRADFEKFQLDEVDESFIREYVEKR